MRKDLQLNLNIDAGRGEESEGKAKLSNLPKSFCDYCRSHDYNNMFGLIRYTHITFFYSNLLQLNIPKAEFGLV